MDLEGIEPDFALYVCQPPDMGGRTNNGPGQVQFPGKTGNNQVERGGSWQLAYSECARWISLSVVCEYSLLPKCGHMVKSGGRELIKGEISLRLKSEHSHFLAAQVDLFSCC